MLIPRIAAVLAACVSLCMPAHAQVYDTLPWYEIDPASQRVAEMFPEADGVLEMGLPTPRIVLADIAYPHGQLTFAMWVGTGMCGLHNCGLKIFDAEGDYLGGAEVCREPESIKIDPTNQFVRLCSDTARAVADLFWNKPPAEATATVASWQGEDLPHMNHNGSVMAVSPSEGTITYAHVREGLRGTVPDGAVLFRGEPWQPGGPFSGTAYTFRKGCEPAPYQVTASYEGFQEVLTLRGDAPVRVRNGCQVTGYSAESGNAVLEFHTTFD